MVGAWERILQEGKLIVTPNGACLNALAKSRHSDRSAGERNPVSAPKNTLEDFSLIAYRQLPDQRIRAAGYRFYWIVGKLLLLLLLSISTPMVFGLNQAHDFSLWWLFVLPASFLVGLFWKGFPAYCKCPGCKRRMVLRSKEGKVIKTHKLFNEIGPTSHYLVCDTCMLSVFLGETGHSD